MNDELYKEKQPVMPKEWPESYYDVEDAAVRNRMLVEHCETEESPEDVIRRELFEKRYILKNGQYADSYVMALYELRMLALENVGPFQKKRSQKQAENALDLLCVGVNQRTDSDNGDEIYFQELKHAVRVYIGICKRDKQYCSVILGQGRKKASSVTLKLVQDFENIIVKLPEKLNIQRAEQMAYLQRALAEAFLEEEPEEDKFYRYLLKAGK